MVARIIHEHHAAGLGFGTAAFFVVVTLVATAAVVAFFLFIWQVVVNWAASEPGFLARAVREHCTNHDIDYSRYPEKFPGPVTLVKKWFLSTVKDGPAQITWDSGRREDTW